VVKIKHIEEIKKMRYKVTVDGTAFVVEVEDLGVSATPVYTAPAPATTPVHVPAPATSVPVPKTASVSAGSVQIVSPMPGKILKVLVSAGQSVKNGDIVVLLEAMKMENEIFATKDGKVTNILVSNGDAVNSGDVLLVIG
jgi:glutaconyl-CoA decarboxylase